MSVKARRRLLTQDLKHMKEFNDQPPGIGCIHAHPDPKNVLKWKAMIQGLEGPWQDGVYELEMNFTDDYPDYPPKVRFITQMFHPNVYANGDICLDILQKQWTPSYDVKSILFSIQCLLNDPNPKSPANPNASELYMEFKEKGNPKYLEKVKLCVAESIKNGLQN